VRAHQTPVQAINAMTGLPYEVFHVDNTATTLPAGTGTWENPFTTLQQAQDAATADYDIVFVHTGQSSTCPYETPADGYQFQANNQYLIGEGTSLQLCTANCGLIDVWSQTASSLYPVITNPSGPAINLQGAATNVTVDHVRITGSTVGISDGAGRSAGTIATVNDVQIYGNGPGQTGVEILSSDNATLTFTKMNLQDMTNDGFYVQGSGAAGPIVNIGASTINNTTGSGVMVNSVNGSDGRVRVTGSEITNSSNSGVFVASGNAYVGTSKFSKNVVAGVYVQDSTFVTSGTGTPGTSNVQVDKSGFKDSAVGIWGVANSGTTNMTITNNVITTNSSPVGANGVILAVGSTTGSGTTGVLNGALVGNAITPVITTTVVDTATTTTATGTTTSTSTTYSSIGNILLSTAGTPIFSGSSGNVIGFNSYGTLNIKAADQAQLQSMNSNAGVALLPVPVQSGSSQYYVIPPPPNFDTSLQVPVPSP